MIKLNLAIWIASVALQCILLGILLRRGSFSRLPIFTILIGFYILRSTAVYTLSSHLGGSYSSLMQSGLGVIDVLLQVAVAWELLYAASLAATRSQSTKSRRGLLWPLGIFVFLLIAAAGFAVLIATRVHANPHVPIDRGVVFTSTFFLLVLLASLAKGARDQVPTLVRRITGGFALYGAISILCQIGRTVAAVDRNFSAFNGWSYTEAAAYVAAVLIWIFALSVETNEEFQEISGPRNSEIVLR